MRPAVFFDRDGVLNVEKNYLYKIEDFQWQNDAIKAIKYLKDKGFYVFVVTNQSGIARGYYTEADLLVLHEFMQTELKKIDAPIDKFYYCPHYEKADIEKYRKSCGCRKPEPGMILKAFSEHDIDKKHSFLIGDRPSDIKAAEKAGLRGYLYKKGSLYEFVKEIMLTGV